MDESTTTPAADDTGVEASTQPVETSEPQAAENQPAEPTTTDSQEAATPVDDNLKWLQENKGIDPSSPEALAKLADMYRNAETQLRSTRNDAKLQDALTQPDQPAEDFGTVDPNAQLAAEVQALKTERAVERFFTQNPDAKAYEATMAEMVVNDPNLNYLVNNNVLSVSQLYQMAKGADQSREAQIKSEGGREALQKVADKQQAKAVPGSATSSQMSAPQVTRENFDSWYAGLTPDQRTSPETQNIVASLLS